MKQCASIQKRTSLGVNKDVSKVQGKEAVTWLYGLISCTLVLGAGPYL